MQEGSPRGWFSRTGESMLNRDKFLCCISPSSRTGAINTPSFHRSRLRSTTTTPAVSDKVISLALPRQNVCAMNAAERRNNFYRQKILRTVPFHGGVCTSKHIDCIILPPVNALQKFTREQHFNARTLC